MGPDRTGKSPFLVAGSILALAALFVVAVVFNTVWIGVNTLVGAGLGYLGWTWAKYVDF